MLEPVDDSDVDTDTNADADALALPLSEPVPVNVAVTLDVAVSEVETLALSVPDSELDLDSLVVNEPVTLVEAVRDRLEDAEPEAVNLEERDSDSLLVPHALEVLLPENVAESEVESEAVEHDDGVFEPIADRVSLWHADGDLERNIDPDVVPHAVLVFDLAPEADEESDTANEGLTLEEDEEHGLIDSLSVIVAHALAVSTGEDDTVGEGNVEDDVVAVIVTPTLEDKDAVGDTDIDESIEGE